MNVLVIGQGGREHALVRALRKSPKVAEVHALPGSDGMLGEAVCHDLNWQEFGVVRDLISEHDIELVIIGPEVPLAGGLSDALRGFGIPVVGPSQEAAQLESSKIYSKEFMVAAGIPTARYEIVQSVEQTLSAAPLFTPPYVLKADGLAAGKGVFICDDLEELRQAAHALFVERVLGPAGERALLEQYQPGYEISYLVLTNGTEHQTLVLAQDHKRLADGDRGPNTGGMGVVAPLHISEELRNQIERDVIAKSVAELKKRNLVYRGVLYAGLMITEDGPSLLEFNTRFGDPEAQVILPLLEGDWLDVFMNLAEGRMVPLEWKKQAACCLVMAAQGYPDHPVKGASISGLESVSESETSYVLHAGTRKNQGRWETAGGRVLNVVGFGSTLQSAVNLAYRCAGQIKWDGVQMRNDIGAKILTSSSSY